MEVNKIHLNQIGLDRVKIIVKIESIDLSKIPNITSLSYAGEYDAKCILVSNSETRELIRIKRYKQNMDGYGIEVKSVSNEIEVNLDITMPCIYYKQGHNVYNIHTEDQVKETLRSVKKYLEEDGIYLNPIKSWEVRSMEINYTYECNIQKERYMDCLKYIYRNVNEKYKYHYSNRATLEKNNIKIIWDAKNMKIYDKTAQMLDTYDKKLDSQIYRTELTYLKKASVRSAFGSNKIDILYDFKKIRELYEYEVKRLGEFMKESINNDIEELKSKVEGVNYRYIQSFYNENSDKLFDISYMAVVFSDEYKKRENNKFVRDFKNLFEKIDVHKKYRHEDLFNLLSAMTESDYKFTPEHNKNVDRFMYRE